MFEIEGTGEWTELFGHKEDLATALLNIVSNAVHWLEASQTPAPIIKIHIKRVGDQEVGITIEDNGPGVPDEFAERIFDLKFTLKEGGTGLGLNIAQEALARSGGKLFFHPEFEGGSKFEIRFPRYRGDNA